MRAGIVGLLLVIVGCTPFPRYAKHASVTPRETIPFRESYTTNDYIRLGLILQRYLGKPYVGKSRYEEGLDCSMFVRDVFREFNKTDLPRTVEEQYAQGTEVPHSRITFGDLVFFRTERGRISHVGVYVGHNDFIHVSSSNGVIISGLSEQYWAERYAGAKRILSDSRP
ncbi:MAG TPA: NlpC/P60 family protein [Acidobacteriota bacterium]|nr:NlpC/P60 family protein [Acidobacteriota bacterium]